MQATMLDTREATSFGAKWFAARDARMRNYANSTLYSEAQKIRAERMKLVLEMLYAAKNIHINFRKSFVAIKIDAPLVKDRKNLRAIEADWESEGITKCITKQGVVYRILN